jgi:norsolorinic acid ketoreductase
LTESLLRRPNTTVIATTRSSSVDASALQGLPTAANTKLVITTLSSNADTGAAAVIDEISKQGISHIDTVVANAGLGDAFHPVLATPVDEIRLNFEVNTLGPIKLFQAAFPLLEKATNPKFILISSVLGSIGGTEGELARAPTLAYGVSKAGANYFVRKVHCEHENVVAVAVHPG